MDPDPAENTLAQRLAADRTRLANERTLLAYLRTALGMLVVGGSLLKFFDGGLTNILAVAFLLAGAAIAVLGFYRAIRTHRSIDAMMRR